MNNERYIHCYNVLNYSLKDNFENYAVMPTHDNCVI